jgi:hypothetical protein
MAFTITSRRSDLNIKQDDMLASKRYVAERKPDSVYFYELEEAVVLDIILDENHPEFANGKLEPDEWPVNIDGSDAIPGDKDYGFIGKIKFRFLNSGTGRGNEKLEWAFPIENTGITEWPLINEIVIVGKYMKKVYYYSRKLNYKQVVNSNVSFMTDQLSGYVKKNRNEGPLSTVNSYGGSDYTGVLGNYFKFNPKIRMLKRFEGDTILESRFGSSVRFGAYDNVRKNDNGLNDYEDGGGNPMILIRNRQAPVTNEQGFTAKGYTTENINLDGSSIHATSGKTISEFIETTKKIMFQMGVKEEQENYSPNGSTDFEYPTLDGDQVIINSDRLIFSSKANETFHFSKKRLSMVTDDEFTVDAHKQIVMTTNAQTTINSPKIYLGAFGDEDEPVLLGRTSVFWMYTLCNWIIAQTDLLIDQAENWHAQHVHDLDSHKDTQTPPKSNWASKMKDYASQLRTMKEQLIALRDSLPTLMSNRVFTVGGGGAPGYDGGTLMED